MPGRTPPGRYRKRAIDLARGRACYDGTRQCAARTIPVWILSLSPCTNQRPNRRAGFSDRWPTGARLWQTVARESHEKRDRRNPCPESLCSLQSRNGRLAAFTHDLFSTPHHEANPAAVAAVPASELDFAGIALHVDRKTLDKVIDRLPPPPLIHAPKRYRPRASQDARPRARSSDPDPPPRQRRHRYGPHAQLA